MQERVPGVHYVEVTCKRRGGRERGVAVAKRLRRTLPKDFGNLCFGLHGKWSEQDVASAKEMLAACEPTARERGLYERTALHCNIPLELAEWLVERGADVNATNSYDTPLSAQSGYGNYDVCKLLIDHGADANIENYAGQTALFKAADAGAAKIVELLLAHGADPCHRSGPVDDNKTPLLYMLGRVCDLPTMEHARKAEALVAAQRARGGIPQDEWEQAQREIARLGRRFAECRDGLDERVVRFTQCDTAVSRLYELFNVEPVAPTRIAKHGEGEPIEVDAALSVDDAFRFLWDYLVPAHGACDTAQGEAIRIVGRVERESKDNGGSNWDREYQKMLEALISYLGRGAALPDGELAAARRAADAIDESGGLDWDEVGTLKALAVAWVRKNPAPIPLGSVGYRR